MERESSWTDYAITRMIFFEWRSVEGVCACERSWQVFRFFSWFEIVFLEKRVHGPCFCRLRWAPLSSLLDAQGQPSLTLVAIGRVFCVRSEVV